MDYSRAALAEALAIDYVVGTLRGGARRRYEALLPAHPTLREATRVWQDRLIPLTVVLEPVAPPAAVWQRVVERIDGGSGVAAREPAAPGFWQRVSAWRALSALTGLAAIAFALLLANPAAVPPPVVVVLAATGAAPSGSAPAAIVASIGGDGRSLVRRDIVPVSTAAGRSLELWAVPKGGAAPRSLGLLPTGNGTVALRGASLAGIEALAVSDEPAGGSPTGVATGPIVYAGKLAP